MFLWTLVLQVFLTLEYRRSGTGGVFVQLLLNRGATSPSFLNTLKTKTYAEEDGFRRRIVAPVQGQGGVTLSYGCPPSTH